MNQANAAANGATGPVQQGIGEIERILDQQMQWTRNGFDYLGHRILFHC